MKNYFALISICVLFSTTAISQKICKLYYFDSLSNQDIINLESIAKSLKFEGDIILENFYDTDYYLEYDESEKRGQRFVLKADDYFYKTEQGENNYNYRPTNNLYGCSSDEVIRLGSIENKVIIEIADCWRWDNVEYSLKINSNDFRRTKIKKSIRKELRSYTTDKINYFVYGNTKVPYLYSAERARNAYKQKKENNKELSDLRVSYRFPKVKTPRVEPINYGNEDFYRISIDSVGYFDKYEISLNVFFDSSPTLLISEEIDLNQDDTGMVFFKKGASLEIIDLYFNAEYLTTRLVDVKSNFATAITKIKNDDCETCLFEELYKYRYALNIRGLACDYTEEDFWSKSKVFMFQCKK